MYFIEGFYLYTDVGSSGRGVLASSKGVTGAIRVVPVCQKDTSEGCVMSPYNWWQLLEKIALCQYLDLA